MGLPAGAAKGDAYIVQFDDSFQVWELATSSYVSKAGDVVNGPLRWANSGSVSSFNGRDVYLYYDGTFFRCQLPSERSAWRIENRTGQVTFGSVPAAAGLPTTTSDLANKGYVDSRLTAVLDELTALAQARIPLQVDIGFGDAVTPAAEQVEYPVLLDDLSPPRLGAHPVYAVIAKKLEACLQLGMVNTRLKDYFDLLVLLEREQVDQQVHLGLSREFAEDPDKQGQWRAFLRRNELKDVPLKRVVTQIRVALPPVLLSAAELPG